MRVGLGQDTHRLVSGRPLLIGGVRVESDTGEDAFSDGDVLIHAVIDSLLGPTGLGDIGSVFPAGTEELRGIDSRVLLRRSLAMIMAAGWSIENIDCVVMLERPKLSPRMAEIRSTLASDLRLPLERVTVKAKTGEGVDAVGEGRAVTALAVALVQRHVT